jgi:Zn-dependent protease with chaperone function
MSVAIYWFFPARKIRRERLQPLGAEDATGVADELNCLCQNAELSTYPSFIWNPLKLDLPSVFGRPPRYYVSLSGAFIARFFYTDRAAFRAIVLHELAHFRNADVDKTYLTLASLGAFAVVALIPSAAALLWPGVSWRPVSDILLKISWSTALVVLTGIAVLRAREYYADVRASVWDGTSTNLERVLAAFPPFKPGRWQRLFEFHPDSTERQQVLKDTDSLFRGSFGMR